MTENPVLKIPELALILLIGPSGSGKSSFGHRHFLPTEVISSDFCRSLVADDENDQHAIPEAFDLLYTIAAKRLAAGRLTVLDAPHVETHSRQRAIQLARQYHVLPVAIVLNMPEALCQARNAQRRERQFDPHVVTQQQQQLRKSLKYLKQEGFRYIYILDSPEQVEKTHIERIRPWTDRRTDPGPFDIIGDIHGCADELKQLLQKLGYQPDAEAGYLHPQGRRVIFLGDLVDRGPHILDCLNLAMRMTRAGTALCLPGNHEQKLLRWLQGKNVKQTHGLQQTVAEIEALPIEKQRVLCREMETFLNSLVSHYVLDEGRLVVAHAGMRAELQGRSSGRVHAFALYGETTGETDEFGLPVRYNWAKEYRGRARVVYGHTPVPEAEWLNGTLCIDTGCVFGGKLTALRYPEQELVQIPAAQVYCEPIRPLFPKTQLLSAQQYDDRQIDPSKITGKQVIKTRLKHQISIQAENVAAALEVLSKFAVDPRWLIYLPPTLSPCETTTSQDFLEHPLDALNYYRRQGLETVICQEKHMGCRAVVIVCRHAEISRQRFGSTAQALGTCYTRTGRLFFTNPELEQNFLEYICQALTQANWWEQFETDWFCFDSEILSWSAKAGDLIREQYATMASTSSEEVIASELQHSDRLELARAFHTTIQGYGRPVHRLEDYQWAPFQILASEGRTYYDQTHRWQMENLNQLVKKASGLFKMTRWLEVSLVSPESIAHAMQWWLELTDQGGGGMVVKPLYPLVQGDKGYVQPGMKCRSKEYLRLVYGPGYTQPEHLQRLKKRNLRSKRSLALQEFALGMEALERFISRAPLREVQHCIAGLLALKSEPVGPRL